MSDVPYCCCVSEVEVLLVVGELIRRDIGVNPPIEGVATLFGGDDIKLTISGFEKYCKGLGITGLYNARKIHVIQI